MKFCYADESGHGAEIVVVAGVIVDATRMNRTKSDWGQLISILDENSNGRLVELKGRELYRGNATWREWDGGVRSKIIDIIIRWMNERRHAITFGAVSKSRLRTACAQFDLDGLEQAKEWCIAAFHLMLGVQKNYQRLKKNKGNSVFVFDNVAEFQELLRIVDNPPTATEGFYRRDKNQLPLDQVIDVPYCADSRHVGLIQVADLFAYILRLYADISEGVTPEKFEGERDRLQSWIEAMGPVLLPNSARWPRSSSEPCTEFLRQIAPPSLLQTK